MISISDPIKNPNQIKYHLAMARVGYYANLYEDTGQWAGKGAELLGLFEFRISNFEFRVSRSSGSRAPSMPISGSQSFLNH